MYCNFGKYVLDFASDRSCCWCAVERRRRDKINNWIVALSKIIPDCSIDGTKTGASKGGILSKACDYIGELKQHNQRLQESLRAVERVQMDNELLRQQLEELKSENGLLRAQLEHHGIDTIADASAQWASDILGKRFWPIQMINGPQRMTQDWSGPNDIRWLVLESLSQRLDPLMSDTLRLEVKGQEVSISTKHQEPMTIYSSELNSGI